MRSLGMQLPDRTSRPRGGGLWREAFFFLTAFLATFLGAMLVIGWLL